MRTASRVAVLALLAAWLVVAWRGLWFLTDDAFITFRYASNHIRGWGWTWNPPPFRPVEGYSNFLWLVLLEGIWRAFGVEPPDAANVVSLLFSFGTAAVVFLAAWRMSLPFDLEPHRFPLAVGALVFLLVNRTFLTWTSSGLETALFVFCLTAWAVALWTSARDASMRWTAAASIAGSLAALTRPDGALFAAAAGLAALDTTRRTRRPSHTLVSAIALAPVAVHLLWRHATYGSWVPNTYYAKVVEPWPEAGRKYLASFILEHGLVVWMALALVTGGVALIQRLEGPADDEPSAAVVPRALVLAALGIHLGSLVEVVGGDHFEYRALTHLVPLLALALVGFLARLDLPPRPTFAILAAVTAASIPIPLVHWVRCLDRVDRGETLMLNVPVADAFPAGPLREYAAQFDRLQSWLIPRAIAMRHQEHRVFARYQAERLPSREAGLRAVPRNGRLLIAEGSVGVLGWTHPEAIVIDTYGLNDRIVARNPLPTYRPIWRHMGHDRTPPPGYLECFEPWDAVTDDRVRACEHKFGSGLK